MVLRTPHFRPFRPVATRCCECAACDPTKQATNQPIDQPTFVCLSVFVFVEAFPNISLPAIRRSTDTGPVPYTFICLRMLFVLLLSWKSFCMAYPMNASQAFRQSVNTGPAECAKRLNTADPLPGLSHVWQGQHLISPYNLEFLKKLVWA